MNKKSYIIAGAVLIALCLTAFGLWRYNAGSQREFERIVRQYAQIEPKLAQYKILGKISSPQSYQGNLFAQINNICADLGMARRVEALRPSENMRKGQESLDLQLRGLYLGECLRFLDAVEKLARVRTERLTLNRRDDRLLDLEMRITGDRDGEQPENR